MAFEYIAATLAQRSNEALLRERVLFDFVSANELSYEGKRYDNFASNDYLGLASEPVELVELGGSASSALVTGYQQIHKTLEQKLCNLLGYEACLLFNSGFSANVSVVKSLMDHNDSEIFQDKLNHASLIDGGLQAKAANSRFSHNNFDHLRRLLEKSKAKNKLIISEGVFSMDGDRADIKELSAIAKAHNAWLMIDDAHGFGVLGENGLGSCTHIKPEILVLTFGKAMGASGAAVLCSEHVANYLLQTNREYTYSTSMAPLTASLLEKRLGQLQAAEQQRTQLNNNIRLFRELASANKLAIMDSQTAIQPLVVGDSETAIKLSQLLRHEGIWLTAIRPPTVPHNTARLRITITAAHSQMQIERLVSQLVKHVKC